MIKAAADVEPFQLIPTSLRANAGEGSRQDRLSPVTLAAHIHRDQPWAVSPIKAFLDAPWVGTREAAGPARVLVRDGHRQRRPARSRTTCSPLGVWPTRQAPGTSSWRRGLLRWRRRGATRGGPRRGRAAGRGRWGARRPGVPRAVARARRPGGAPGARDDARAGHAARRHRPGARPVRSPRRRRRGDARTMRMFIHAWTSASRCGSTSLLGRTLAAGAPRTPAAKTSRGRCSTRPPNLPVVSASSMALQLWSMGRWTPPRRITSPRTLSWRPGRSSSPQPTSGRLSVESTGRGYRRPRPYSRPPRSRRC